MSLSDNTLHSFEEQKDSAPADESTVEIKPAVWGTIYTPNGEQTLGSVEKARSTQWTPSDEESYLGRVRNKAQAMASDLLSEAQIQADHLKETAHQQGYEQGLAQAEEELENFRSGMADSVSAVLSSIEGQCSHIFSQWKTDILDVARIAVEKTINIELAADRKGILESLITDAITTLEQSKVLTIHVNPEDAPVLSDIIGVTQTKYPEINSWRVKEDPSITPGGMIIESDSSLATSLVESRRIAVDRILEHLTLPDKLP